MLRNLPFETAIIEWYRIRESSVEEALMEMYLAGVSVRRVEDITEDLWGSRVSSSTISELNRKIYKYIDKWIDKPLEAAYPYMFVDGIWLKRSWGGVVQSVSVLVAIGVNQESNRKILGMAEGSREDAESWRNFFRYLKQRGLEHVRLIVSDKALGVLEAIGDFFPKSRRQRCIVHFYRNVLSAVPVGKSQEVGRMLKAIHAQKDREAAHHKAEEVASKPEDHHLGKVEKLIRAGAEETFSFYDPGQLGDASEPITHWRGSTAKYEGEHESWTVP